MRPQTFVWLAGQDDNIGDVVLRRRLLRVLQAQSQCHVYLGHQSRGYVDGLELAHDSVRYTSGRAWWRAGCVAAARARATVVFNPGEISSDRASAIGHAALVPMAALARVRGSRVARVGIGARDATFPGRLPIDLCVRLSSVNVWRDEWSASVYRRGQVRPDWAFDDDGPTGTTTPDVERTTLSVSVRGDRPAPGDEWVKGIRQACEELGLEPVTFAQVRRDGDVNEALAARLGGTWEPWPPDVQHAAHEAKVRGLFARSAAVVSDRLHALVMACTQGALPVGAMEHADTKVRRSLAAAGIHAVSADVTGWDADRLSDFVLGVLDRGPELRAASVEARDAVRNCDALLVGRP